MQKYYKVKKMLLGGKIKFIELFCSLKDFSRIKAYELIEKARGKIRMKKRSKSISELLREDRKSGHFSDRVYLTRKNNGII